MKSELKVSQLSLKEHSYDLELPGDYCIVKSLASTGNAIPGEKIILKCPFCSGDMASTFQTIVRVNSLWRRLCGLPPTISISHMLQCPYNTAHTFLIKKGRVKSLIITDGKNRSEKIHPGHSISRET